MREAGLAASDAAHAVVDGFEDNGIDAIYYDPHEQLLYMVQSKWIQRERGTWTAERYRSLFSGDNVDGGFGRP